MVPVQARLDQEAGDLFGGDSPWVPDYPPPSALAFFDAASARAGPRRPVRQAAGGAEQDAFPWHLALDEAFSMTGFGGE